MVTHCQYNRKGRFLNMKSHEFYHLCILSLILLTLTLAQSPDPLYTISAPNSFRPNSFYQLLITNHQAPASIDVKADIKLQSSNETKPLVAQEAKIEVGQTKLIDLPIGEWSPGTYLLTVNGSGGIEFSKRTILNLHTKTFSVFIQTDKAIYKPSQIVHFRVIATDVALKPFETKDSSLHIIDSQGNRVKQWQNLTFTKGVYEGSLQLSDQVILGDWRIKANIKSNKFEKSFTIEEYVLPTFEVSVKLPPFATYNDSIIIITVDSKYTYGKPVKGNVLVNVTDMYCSYPCEPYNMKPLSLKTSIDGKAEIKVDLVKDMALPDWMRYQQQFKVSAQVTEDLTGRQQKGEGEITLHDSKYLLSFSNTGNFKPGLKHSVTLRVSLQDGSPILEDGDISVRYYESWSSPVKTLNFSIPKNGEIEIEVVPSDISDLLRFETNYKGSSAYTSISRAQSLSERHLQITLLSQNPKVGDDVQLLAESTSDLRFPLILQVIGRGRILYHETIAPSNDKKQNITLKMQPDMAPKVRLVIYYATHCGEVVADAIDFSVDGVFKTKVDIEITPNSTKPGSTIDINIATEPQAYVGLLAVDQSVLLLKSGNDITTKEILDDLQGYEIGSTSYYTYTADSYVMRPWRPSAPSTAELFSDVGLILLTNGIFPYTPPADISRTHAVYEEAALYDSVEFGTDSGVRNSGGFSGGFQEPTRVRRHFPETFLWTNLTSSDNGVASIKTNAPDTITSYVITAFAMDEEKGLGLSKSPSKLQIFRQFFIALNLPYSIVRGESVALQAIIFNYLKEDVEAEITLENENNALEFVELKNTVDDTPNPKKMSKMIKAKAGQGTSVSFLVSAKKLGYVDIKVVAKSALAADAILKKLLVKAEGKPVYFNKALLVDLREKPSFEEKINIEIPEDAVSDSERIEVSAIGDILGSTINNLDQLLRMPYGCGEQNMVNFVPNIAITDYLTKSKQLNNEIKSKALKFMETGYQRELTYKRHDNSFSAFGNSDKNGSVWLTAFVLKSFIQAKDYITVDDAVVKNSLTWLSSKQAENGSFSEVGNVFNKAMQGGSGKGLGLTAYVLSAFLESKAIYKGEDSIEKTIRSSLDLLEKELPNINSDYDLIITAYVLQLADSSKKDEAFEKMNKRARTERDLKYWSMPLPEINKTLPYYDRPNSVDVELTSYALLTYVLRGLISDGVPIMRWLISKRNSQGGFESTQDTVMGIQALAKFAASLTPPDDSHADISVSYETDKKSFGLTKDTALILHREQISNTARDITIRAEGNGVAVVQVSWSYNILNVERQPSFTVHTNATSENQELNVEACVKYTGNDVSNMAVLEIAFPSGYLADLEKLPPVDREKNIKRVETKDGDTVVILYFDKIGQEVCTLAKAYRKFNVANTKPALIQVYDYYEPDKRGQQFYNGPITSLCELCETSECKEKEKCT